MQRDIEQLRSQRFDVVVVGGGIHGAWITLRAAQAGYRVALIEKNDFGAATSANSLKILHGGLRYLQHLDFARMRSSIKARREFARMSPHLVKPLPCVIPLRALGVRSPWILGPSLLANDLISVDRNSGVSETARLPYGRLLSAKRCHAALAPLADVDAMSGALWWDAVALDTWRLTLQPLLEATRIGALVANRVQATALLSHRGRAAGVMAVDHVSGVDFEIAASAVIDATGPAAGQLSAASKLPAPFLPPGWVGGLNVVLRRSLGIDQAVALSSASKAADRSAVLQRATRELFFVPWRGVTMVGTDYHPVSGAHDARVPAGAVENFIAEISRVAPRARVSLADVGAVHWGLLPLETRGAALPRKSPIVATGPHETGASGFIIVIGEKLTSAPVLSQHVVGRVAQELGVKEGREAVVRSVTSEQMPPVDPREDIQLRLASRYGNEWKKVMDLGISRPELLAPIHPTVEARGVEILHAMRNEMALNLEDVVLRRLALCDVDYPGIDVLKRCASIVASELGWTSEQTNQSVVDLDARFREHRGRWS